MYIAVLRPSKCDHVSLVAAVTLISNVGFFCTSTTLLMPNIQSIQTLLISKAHVYLSKDNL